GGRRPGGEPSRLASGPRAGRADQRLDAREQTLHVDGLGEVVHGAGGESGADVARGLLRADEDDRDVPELVVLLHRPAQLEAVDPAHHHVEQDEVGPIDVEGGDEAEAVGGRGHLAALELVGHLEHLPRLAVVVDEDDLLAARHGSIWMRGAFARSTSETPRRRRTGRCGRSPTAAPPSAPPPRAWRRRPAPAGCPPRTPRSIPPATGRRPPGARPPWQGAGRSPRTAIPRREESSGSSARPLRFAIALLDLRRHVKSSTRNASSRARFLKGETIPKRALQERSSGRQRRLATTPHPAATPPPARPPPPAPRGAAARGRGRRAGRLPHAAGRGRARRTRPHTRGRGPAPGCGRRAAPAASRPATARRARAARAGRRGPPPALP